MVAGLGIAGATPASSAIAYTCASINGLTAVVTNEPAGSADYSAGVDFAAGDTLTATWSDITGTPRGSSLYVPTFRQVATVFESSSTYTLSYTVTAADVETDFWAPEFRTDISGSVGSATITITCGNPSSPSSSAPPIVAPPIPAWVQAYGIFRQDDACEAGWTNSWQKWAEPITGGWVCTRAIPSLG